MTYRAHAAGTEGVLGTRHQKGIGARMLEWATHLPLLACRVERDTFGNPVWDGDLPEP